MVSDNGECEVAIKSFTLIQLVPSLIAQCTRGGEVLFDFYTAHTHLYLLDLFNCFWVIYFGVRLPSHRLVTHTLIFKYVLRFNRFAAFVICDLIGPIYSVKQNVLLALKVVSG